MSTAVPRTGSGTRCFALVAGEDSGDQLGADLIEALRARFPDARFVGIGGARMRAAGFDAWHDIAALSVMGYAEVLRALPRLLRLRASLARRLTALGPDAFIGIDAPDFNLGLERKLKARGIRTVHYVSPSVWAWREGRVRTLGNAANCVLCLFPMEPAIYAQYGVDARFVGHPLADRFPIVPDQGPARDALGLVNGAPVLALLPGSRGSEIKRLGRIFLDAAARVADGVPGLQIVVPAANARCHARLAALVRDIAGTGVAGRITLLQGRSHEALIAADVALLASGTAALEAMLAKRPMVVGYRLAPASYALVKGLRLMRTSWYSLPNMLAGRMLIPELMQRDCTPERLAAATIDWFHAPQRRSALAREFERMQLTLHVGGGAAASAARAIASLLEPTVAARTAPADA